jgi:tryptophan synthase alpha chain
VTTSSKLLPARFEALKRQGRKALVCYLTAGHPTVADSSRLLRGLVDVGADVVEVGIPFSDPLADGPVIQKSSHAALQNGVNLEKTLTMVREAQLSAPVVLMTYLNPVLAGGNGVLDRAASAGVSGILVTDLPVGADPEREAWLAAGPLCFVRLVAPTTPQKRMAVISRSGSGFVYLISRTGVTGERDVVASDLPQCVARLRRVSDLPVCVGFGISSPEQARQVASYADGVVVGSAIVRAAEERGVDAALELVAGLRSALDAA